MRYISLVAVCLLTGGAVYAGLGFESRLDNLPPVVSPYDDTLQPFSVAIGSRTFGALVPGFGLHPRLDAADFEHDALRFRTAYYRNKELVPVSVDAHDYVDYRGFSFQKRRLSELFVSDLKAYSEGRKRSGLSVGIALPKRFDQMFGEGGANLKVSGYRRISFSGRSQWTDGVTSPNIRQSKFPSLNMEQVSRFDITGTIGSKITVSVSQDSQTDIPLGNRIQLRYHGDEDDVLQTIEAGNTNLSLPNTRFVGYSSRIQGLFGLKAEAQLGNLRLTSILSQEKGSSERASISASGEESARYIRDYQYAEGRIFDLGYPGEFNPNDSVRQLYIYKQDIRESDSSIVHRFYVDSANEPGAKLLHTLQVRQDQFQWLDDPTTNQHYVVFNSIQRDALGIWMEVVRYDDNFNLLGIDTIGSQASDTFNLRFIRAETQDYFPTHKTWNLMWRNCYSIPRGASIEDLNLKVFKGLPGREGAPEVLDYQESGGATQKYITILGLDQYNDGTGKKVPDNVLDERREVFRPDWGLIIFPSRTPFDTNKTYTDADGRQTQRLLIKVPTIYNFTSASQKSQNSQYYIQLSSRSRSSSIRLNRANIIEGSERVTLNGRQLQRGTDYNIDYGFGQITLLSDAATDPNADLQVDFEYAPFFAAQKKTLFGMRAQYDWSDDLKFGTTVLYKSDKAQDRKPRVGQETAKATVYDFDMTLRLHPDFLTNVVDALPLVSTEAKSNLQISGELAQSRPNPNVNGDAFIDDFESASEQVSLGLTRTTWHKAAMPLQLQNSGPYTRAKMLWYEGDFLNWEDVYNSQKSAGEGIITPLRLIFRPNNNHRFDAQGHLIDDRPAPGTTNWWAGITRYFGGRLDAKRLQLFEMRVKTSGRKGILHIDFGRINEDVNADGTDNTEDANGNDAVEPEEDLGLDGLSDAMEDTLNYDPETNPDPNGDDWFFEGQGVCPLPASLCNNTSFVEALKDTRNPLYYEWINGTEGNRDDFEFLLEPDEERLSNSSFNTTDAYFSFEVDLSDPNSPFLVPSSEHNGWVTYRIPIRDSSVYTVHEGGENAEADWAQVTHARIWFEANGLEDAYDTLDIAGWYFVQTNWQDSLISSSKDARFVVASVSEDQDANYKNSGIPYAAYIDPTSRIEEPRSALQLLFQDLAPRDTGFVTKDLVTAESYSGYRRLAMYVYAADSLAGDSVDLFFRLGQDSANFYEYRTRLEPGWSQGNWVDINFNDITGVKDSALRALGDPRAALDVTSGKYRIFGRPNLNQIRFFATGVINQGTFPVSGEVWVDELRVTDVRDDPGIAVRGDITGSLADLVSYNASVEHRDPFFRGLSTATRGGGVQNLGSGQTDNRYAYGVSLNVDRFLPRSWNARIPISFSYSKSEQIPLVRTNSDIVIPADVRREEISTSESRNVRVSESFKKAGKNPLFTALLNRQRFSVSYSRSNRHTPVNPFSFSENYNMRGDYDMGVKNFPRLPIFFWAKPLPLLRRLSGSTLGLYPENWKWSGSFNRSLSITEDTQANRVTSRRRDFDGSMNLTYRLFENLTTSVTYRTRRDLTDPSLVQLNPFNMKLGLETNYSQAFKADYSPSLFGFFTHAFGYSANYSDTYDRTTKTRRSNLSRSWSVSGRFDHIAFLRGKSSGSSGNRGRSPGSGRRRTGRRSSTAKPAGSGRPFYDPPLAVLRFLTRWINPLEYRYNESFTNLVPGMLDRPSMKYRLGLITDPNVRLGSDVRRPSSSEGQSYDLSSGFSLLGGITTDVRFRRQISRDLVRIGGRSERRSTNWPDLTIRITKFSTLPLLKPVVNKFIDIFQPRTAYTRSLREDRNLDLGFLTSKVETIDRNPLLSINFRMLRGLSLSGNYAVNKSNNFRFNTTNGDLVSESRNTRSTFAMSAKWAFSSPSGISIPLFGKLKFKSTVSIDLNVRFTGNKTETSTNGGEFVVRRDQSEHAITPVISYTFSQQIRGGVSALWQDTIDRLGRNSHVRQLQIWTEIRF